MKQNKVLKAIQWILYLAFVFLWFKDNISLFRKIRVSFWISLIPLLLTIFIQLFLKLKQRKIKIRMRFNKTLLAIAILLFLATLFRIPFLIHNFGMTTSDDAIPALMGKHISEGKIPAICYYGQLYMGSLSSHFFALMFKLFGYSIFVLKLSTLFFYLAFIAVHFLFLKEISSFTFSWITSFFYCLPISNLVIVSFDNTSAYSLVLLLGVSLIYISYLISYKKKVHLVSLFGFLAGISFWTHQITGYFILTALLVLAFKSRIKWKKYGLLALSALVGIFPQLILEVSSKFHLIRFLSAGEKSIPSWEKLRSTARFILSLLSARSSPSSYFFLILLLLGFLALVYLAFKEKKLLPLLFYNLFFVIFSLMYLFSAFSNKPVVRYFYPLYFCLPVLLLSVFLLIRSKFKYILSFALILILFFFFNLKGSYFFYTITRDLHHTLNQVISSMKETGKKYWSGDYWTAYLLTALAKEEVIVDSYTVNRYYPYRLFYYNQSKENNFVFLARGEREKGQAARLVALLEAFKLSFKEKKIGESNLVYDIKSPVYPRAFLANAPSNIPDLVLSQVTSSSGYLTLVLKNKQIGEDVSFRLNIEIPGFSRATKRFSLAEEEVQVAIPFPESPSFKIEYYLDYLGLKIPSSAKVLTFTPPKAESKRKEMIVYLSGFGSVTDFMEKRMRVCEKEARLEINEIYGKKVRVRLHLFSPFEFSHLHWYGDYSQEIKINFLGQSLVEKKLKDGENVIEFELSRPNLKESGNIITFQFKYHLPLVSSLFWKISAFLEKIEIE